MKILRFDEFVKQEDTQVNESFVGLAPVGLLWFFFIFMTGLSSTVNFINFVKNLKAAKDCMDKLREVLKPYAKKLEKDDVIGKILNIMIRQLTRKELQSIVDAGVPERLKDIMTEQDYRKFSDIVAGFKEDCGIKDIPNTEISWQDANKLNKCMDAMCNDYYEEYDDGEDTGEDEDTVTSRSTYRRSNDEIELYLKYGDYDRIDDDNYHEEYDEETEEE